jgi:DHA3 family macrolide efflux protein-like MFS transporter
MQIPVQWAVSQGMRVFALVWLGQLVSLVGSGLTEFALGVWVFQRTGSTLQFALVVLFIALPRILLSPLAGALVDRWDRRSAMILSDAGAGLGTLAIGLLLLSHQLEVWHVYVITAVSSAFNTFQWPAYAATITLIVPKEHYGRASGLVQVAQSVASLTSPVLAGFLVVTVGLGGVALIDFATFVFALLTLLAVRFPRPAPSAESLEAAGSLLREAVQAWAYIAQRPGLLGLLMVYAATSFLGITTEVLLTPYLLSFTTADVLGLVVSATGAGLLIGGLVMSTWGGPQRRIFGILGFEMLVAVCTVSIGARSSALLVGVALLVYFAAIALADGNSQALWQAKVAPGVQGRVFAMRRMISLSAFPLGLLIIAPLAEYVFEPLLAVNGPWAGSIGSIVGVGPGRGIGLLFMLTGLFNALVLVIGYLHPRIRLVEDDLPDAVADQAV